MIPSVLEKKVVTLTPSFAKGEGEDLRFVLEIIRP
jgi:hypothetical protein